jgi:excinuclease ABC subunit C
MVQRIARIEALTCDSEHEAAWLERNLLLRTLPPWNRTSGAEVPVFIRVNAQAALPGLSVVHNVLDPGTGVHFGPYLGGHKVRLAVSALHRALPLAYAGESVTGLGRDLARIRDVGPADRQTLVESITAVLNRESAAVTAVRDRLVALRERATEALAYELAQQVQTEIEAYEWIVAEQKVTSAEPDDYDVYGWASGVLVRFEIRGGCLCAWSTRACTETAARTHTATTPARWANFARRNAELAARLVIRR